MKKWVIYMVLMLIAGGLAVWMYPGDNAVATGVRFVMGAGFLFGCFIYAETEARYRPSSRAGDWLQEKCDKWRCTARGVLLYQSSQEGLVLMLPWESIGRVQVSESNITLEDEENDCFYCLPLLGDEPQAVGAHIQEQVERHRAQHRCEENFDNSVYFMTSPLSIPLLSLLLPALPLLLLGLSTPFVPGLGLGECMCCFAGAGCLFAAGWDISDEFFCAECYVGEEIHRGKRGIRLRMNGGIVCFLPWSCMVDGVRLTSESVFLRVRGGHEGFVCRGDGVPLPLRRMLWFSQFWFRRVCRLGAAFLSLLPAYVWWWYWS